MIKKLFYATLACFVTAQKPTTVWTVLGKATDKNTDCEGAIRETLTEGDDQKSLTVWMSWETKNKNNTFPEYSWIQNYAEWADYRNPGKYWSVTCNVGFDPAANFSETISVGNFYGDSIAVRNQAGGKWDTYGTPKVPGSFMFQQVKSEEKKESYKTAKEG